MAKISWILAVLCLFAFAGVFAQTESEGGVDDGDVEGVGDDLPEDTSETPGPGKHHGPALDSVSDIFNCHYLRKHHHHGPRGSHPEHPEHPKHPAGPHVHLTPEEKKEIEDEIKAWKAKDPESNHYHAFQCIPKLKKVRKVKPTTPAA